MTRECPALAVASINIDLTLGLASKSDVLFVTLVPCDDVVSARRLKTVALESHGVGATMQSGNILQIPFRRTHNLLLSAAIKSYISTKYDQHPDVFSRDLEIIDQLRRDAVNAIEPHASGVKKLQAYAAQLVWMGGKFPIDVRADLISGLGVDGS